MSKGGSMTFFSKNFYVGMLLVSFAPLLFSEYKPFGNGSTTKPFNYKALEAKKRGWPIVLYHPAESLETYENVSVAPTWPGYLRFPTREEQSKLYCSVGCNWANKAFNSTGDVVDPSVLFSGDRILTLSDISIIARMHGRSLTDHVPPAADNKSGAWIDRTTEAPAALDDELKELQSVSANPGIDLAAAFRAHRRALAYLADKKLVFNSKMREPFFTLSYQASLFDNKVSLGLEVPLMYRMQEVEMVNSFTQEDNAILQKESKFAKTQSYIQDNFFASYPGGYQEFYRELLRQKNLSSEQKIPGRIGIGDITFNISRRLDKNYWSLGLVGCGLTVPSATQPLKDYVWPNEVGNGGFFEVRPYAAFYWQSSRMLNPHFSGEIKYRFSNRVNRRVSKRITFDAVSKATNIAAKDLPLGSNLIFVNNSFENEPESKCPAFAEKEAQVELKKGPGIIIRVGNIFDQAFTSSGYFDVYYQAVYKFSDSLDLKFNDASYDIMALKEKSESFSQEIHCTYVYRYLDTFNVEFKWNFAFAGRLALRTCGLSAAITTSF